MKLDTFKPFDTFGKFMVKPPKNFSNNKFKLPLFTLKFCCKYI